MKVWPSATGFLMHGPWHLPEHPDERDAAHEEEAAELRRLEAHAEPGEWTRADERDYRERTLTASERRARAPAQSTDPQRKGDASWRP